MLSQTSSGEDDGMHFHLTGKRCPDCRHREWIRMREIEERNAMIRHRERMQLEALKNGMVYTGNNAPSKSPGVPRWVLHTVVVLALVFVGLPLISAMLLNVLNLGVLAGPLGVAITAWLIAGYFTRGRAFTAPWNLVRSHVGSPSKKSLTRSNSRS